ncbi:MAG: hypothetical protein V7849_09005, partial [Candidatus Competibacter sp.]
ADSFNDRGPGNEDWPSAHSAPAAQTQNGITFVTGGIGKPEAAAMKAAAGHYDLMITFADRSGDYVADVDVKIQDAKGNTVLNTVSDPILLVDLPAGRYTVRADVDGKSLVRTLNLPASTNGHPTEVVYRWPQDIS